MNVSSSLNSILLSFILFFWQNNVALREKCQCPNTKFFLVRIFLSEYRKTWTRENSVFGNFLRSDDM